MKAWYWCRMNGDEQVLNWNRREKKSQEDVLQHSQWMVIAVCCSAVNPRKKKPKKGVRDLFSKYIQGLIKAFLLAIKNRLDKTSNGSQNWMANKKHSGPLLIDSALGTWARYKTAWIIGWKKEFQSERWWKILLLWLWKVFLQIFKEKTKHSNVYKTWKTFYRIIAQRRPLQ